MPATTARLGALLLALALVAAGCGSDPAANEPRTSTSAADASAAPEPGEGETGHGAGEGDGHAASQSQPVRQRPLRQGERRVALTMPADYTPSAPTGTGTDDYRCFLLDPKVAADQFITGFNVLPGNPDVVHHVILFQVPADMVAEAEDKDASTPGEGWTCFGGSGLSNGSVDAAPWLGAWAPGGREQVLSPGFGVALGAGSRVVMQVHYNLNAGVSPDRSGVSLRLRRATDDIQALQTRLLPAPVELPCRAAYDDGPLCERPAAMADVKKRFGQGPGALGDVLHMICGPIRASSEQSCTRTIGEPETVRAVAGHMHLLGRSIRIEVNPGKPDARTLLDIENWDFDDQGSIRIDPVRLEPFDTLKVTCRHDQSLRDRLPAFEGQPDRYVVWGEGTTDEMCLGIVQVTRP